MKTRNLCACLSGMVLLGAFVLFIVWSVVPFRGKTLPHLLEMNWHWSFLYSAGWVSAVSAVMGMSALLIFTIVAVKNDDFEKRKRE